MKAERPSREALIRYYWGGCSPQEEELIEVYLSMDIDHEYVESCLREAWNDLDSEARDLLTGQQLGAAWNRFQQKKVHFNQLPASDELGEGHQTERIINEITGGRQKHAVNMYLRVAVAAVVLLFVITGGYFLISKQQATVSSVAKNIPNDVAPGKSSAILTLASGKKINLDATGNGRVASQSGITITKANNGKVVYTVANQTAGVNSKPEFNTIETPRGGQYQINLPDGTKVWLNAASSIKFPTVFLGNERNVTLTGEGYFEVAHLMNKPFNVYASGVQVHVLGTHFNINAYEDEDDVKTTLLEGSVKLTHNNVSALLKPGEQGKVKPGGLNFIVAAADTGLVTAWKNELFKFNNTDLHSLMRQLARWYNIDVVYEGSVPDDVFFGKIERKASLAKALKVLELDDVHFKIEGRKLIVMP